MSIWNHSSHSQNESRRRNVFRSALAFGIQIGDFGTSRWAQHSDSTGLATYKTNAGDIMKMMSFAWAAPEVLT